MTDALSSKIENFIKRAWHLLLKGFMIIWESVYQNGLFRPTQNLFFRSKLKSEHLDAKRGLKMVLNNESVSL